MKTLDLVQGSPEWLAIRAKSFTASEAAAMLGLSDKVKRTELLHMKATGTAKEFSDWVQKNLLDKGHEVEADTRPIVEHRLKEDLYPTTGADEVEGLPLLASFDGITMMEDVCWENKMWNTALVEYIQTNQDAPDTHWPQLEQQLLVSGADRVLFTVCDGTESHLSELWYQSKPERRALLIGGWKQFAKDLAEYKPDTEQPANLTGKAPDTLPALRIEVTGAVTASNLAEFKETALTAIRSVNRTLETDQDFADAEQSVKWCGEVETRLAAAKEHALSQTTSIDQLFKAIDDISAEARKVRLDLEKLVKQRKDAIRDSIILDAKQQLAAHVVSLNATIGKAYMPAMAGDFAGAIKGKRTLASLRDAAGTELARVKVEANAIADKLAANLKTLHALAADHLFLFADEALIVHKSPDDLALLIKSRLDAHQQAEREREERERQQREAAEAATAAAAAAKAAQPAAPAAPAASVVEEAAADLFAQPPVAANQEEAAPRGAPTLRLGMINERLGFDVSVKLLASLGFTATQEGAARLFHEADFIPICRALVAHIRTVATGEQREAA
jgi:predicted phage-related endonuclease